MAHHLHFCDHIGAFSCPFCHLSLLVGGIAFIQILALSLDCSIALWEFSPSSRCSASLKGLFYSHISKYRPAFTWLTVFQRLVLILMKLHLLFFLILCAFWVLRHYSLTRGHKYLRFLWEILLLNAYIKVCGLFLANFYGCWGKGKGPFLCYECSSITLFPPQIAWILYWTSADHIVVSVYWLFSAPLT